MRILNGGIGQRRKKGRYHNDSGIGIFRHKHFFPNWSCNCNISSRFQVTWDVIHFITGMLDEGGILIPCCYFITTLLLIIHAKDLETRLLPFKLEHKQNAFIEYKFIVLIIQPYTRNLSRLLWQFLLGHWCTQASSHTRKPERGWIIPPEIS